MKVVQINVLARTNSTGRTTYEMHRELERRNVKSYVFSSALGKNEEDYGQIIINSRADMHIHSFLARLTGFEGYYSNLSTKRLIECLKKIKPEAVILRNLHTHYINIQTLCNYLKREKIATIIVLHDFWLVTGHCVYPSMNCCNKFKIECSECEQLKEGIPSWFFDTSRTVWKQRRKLFSDWKNCAVVGVSEWSAHEAQSTILLKNIKSISAIYNWIDKTKFRYMNVTDTQSFVVLGVASIWLEPKGIEDFIKLSYMLQKDEKLILVGKCPIEYKQRLNRERVQLIEYTDSEKELVRLYNRASVFVSCSKQETFGKTIAEAITCGTPAVVYNTTACPELVSNGCGYAVALQNIQEVYSSIQTIKKNGKEMYIENCLKKAETDFSLEKNVDQYINLIKMMKEKKDGRKKDKQ